MRPNFAAAPLKLNRQGREGKTIKVSNCTRARGKQTGSGTFIGEFVQSRKIAAAVERLPGQIFRVGLTRFRLEKEDYQGDKLKMVDRLTAGAA